MEKLDPEIGPFSKFIEVLEPWLSELVLIGGWAHRLYRLDPRSRQLGYVPLTTLDGDVALPGELGVKVSIRDRLLRAGFTEELMGDDQPPATHYHYGDSAGFYVEFLTALKGSDYDRKGKRKATESVGGVTSQRLRYIEILMLAPWELELGDGNGFLLKPAQRVRIANPASFLAQKILIHHERNYRERAKDVLYIHDTIEMFSDKLGELRGLYENEVRPMVHPNQVRELLKAPREIFGNLSDSIREAAVMAGDRKLDPEALRETCERGLKEILG